MHLKSLKIRITVISLLCLGICFNGCASQADEKAEDPKTPKPQIIRVADPKKSSSENPATSIAQTVKKDLFNIRLSADTISINGTKMRDAKALKDFLSKQSKPVITISAHRCFSSEKATEVMSIARDFTDTPIAYESFGAFSDPECQ